MEVDEAPDASRGGARMARKSTAADSFPNNSCIVATRPYSSANVEQIATTTTDSYAGSSARVRLAISEFQAATPPGAASPVLLSCAETLCSLAHSQPPSSTSSPSIMNEAESPSTAASKKRSADGCLKATTGYSGNLPNTMTPASMQSLRHVHSRNASVQSSASNRSTQLEEMSARLQTNLQYLYAKVRHGVADRSLNELVPHDTSPVLVSPLCRERGVEVGEARAMHTATGQSVAQAAHGANGGHTNRLFHDVRSGDSRSSALAPPAPIHASSHPMVTPTAPRLHLIPSLSSQSQQSSPGVRIPQTPTTQYNHSGLSTADRLSLAHDRDARECDTIDALISIGTPAEARVHSRGTMQPFATPAPATTTAATTASAGKIPGQRTALPTARVVHSATDAPGTTSGGRKSLPTSRPSHYHTTPRAAIATASAGGKASTSYMVPGSGRTSQSLHSSGSQQASSVGRRRLPSAPRPANHLLASPLPASYIPQSHRSLSEQEFINLLDKMDEDQSSDSDDVEIIIPPSSRRK